jgi:molecular chaperone GrpE
MLKRPSSLRVETMWNKEDDRPGRADAAPEVEPVSSGVTPDDSVEPAVVAADEEDAVRRERDEFRDLLLRKTAEFDNFRKRVDRERRDQAAAGVADLLEALLPIVDDLERALGAGDTPSTDAYRAGVEIIHRQMLELLARRGVKPIGAVGADFDPRFHQAVLTEDSPGHRDGEVIEEFRRGYVLGDRLLRPAMVKVAKA